MNILGDLLYIYPQSIIPAFAWIQRNSLDSFLPQKALPSIKHF